MSRQLFAFVLAVLLCGQAVVVFAQILVEAGMHRDLVARTLRSEASATAGGLAPDADATAGAPVSADDADLGHGIEIVFAGAFEPVVALPGSLPRSSDIFSSSTFFAPPEPPPRTFSSLA